MKAWSIRHITEELRDSFQQCQTELERTMWRIYAGKDCSRILAGREPTPGERAILNEYGIVLMED